MKLQYFIVRTAELAHVNTKKFVKLCDNHALGSGYPRNGTSMDMSLLALVHLVMKRTIQMKARRNILLVSYAAMPRPYGSFGG